MVHIDRLRTLRWLAASLDALCGTGQPPLDGLSAHVPANGAQHRPGNLPVNSLLATVSDVAGVVALKLGLEWVELLLGLPRLITQLLPRVLDALDTGGGLPVDLQIQPAQRGGAIAADVVSRPRTASRADAIPRLDRRSRLYFPRFLLVTPRLAMKFLRLRFAPAAFLFSLALA